MSSEDSPALSTPAASPSQAPLADRQVLYRKWRPKTFAEVVGQEPVTRTLRNAVAGGRIAHAYLFCGPRGTGKTSLGRLLAKAVNCADPAAGEPCNSCPSCLAYLEGRAADLVEMDAASNRGIEEMRRLKERVGLAPMGGGKKVYLVDEVHMLTQEAYNALLKTLEEPPPYVIFVLATTEPHRVPSTIISRCQRFDLRRIPLQAVVERLALICREEGLQLDDASLQEVARSAGGSLRDAINTLEQLTAFYGTAPTMEQVSELLGLNTDARSYELARAVLSAAVGDGLRIIAAARDDGVDMRQFSRQVVRHLRELLLVKAGAAATLDLPQEHLQEAQALVSSLTSTQIVRAIKLFSPLDFRDDPHSSLPLELALIEFASNAQEPAAARASGEAAPASPAEPKSSSRRTEDLSKPSPEAKSEPAEQEVPPPSETALAPFPELPPDLLKQIRLVCKDSDHRLAAMLNGSCELLRLEGDSLVFGVYFNFHLEKLEAPANRRIIENAASQVLGRPLTIRCELVSPPPVKQSPRSLVEAAQEMGAMLLEGQGPP